MYKKKYEQVQMSCKNVPPVVITEPFKVLEEIMTAHTGPMMKYDQLVRQPRSNRGDLHPRPPGER